MNILQAILLGMFSFLGSFGCSYDLLFEFTCVPMCMSAIAGIILGDPKMGLMCGAIIQPMYLSFMNAGGNVPADKGNASLVATSVVIASGLNTEVALAMTIPLALILAQLNNVKKILRGFVNEMAEKAAIKGDEKGIYSSIGLSALISVVLYWIPISVICYLGAGALSNLTDFIPQWLSNGLSVVGGLLPAIGVGATMIAIGRKDFLPFFIFGFFICAYTGIGSIQLLVYAGLLVFFYFVISKQNLSQEDMNLFAIKQEENKDKILTKKDIFWLWERWHFFCETATSFARLQAQGFCVAFMPLLKKLYKDKPEEYKEALASHMQFYNTSGNFGGLINGIVASMEEERAMGNYSITRENINSIKVGLMGPVSGIGDTIDFSCIKVIMLALFVTYAQAGALWAPWAYLGIMFVYWYAEGLFLTNIGYKFGAQVAAKILGSKLVKLVFSCAALLGFFMIGGMSASFVSVHTGIAINTASGLAMSLQSDVLDLIAPGILSLASILGVYKYLSNKGSIIKATWALLFIGLLLGGLGILV